MSERSIRPPIVLPVIFIALGTLAILQNMGYLPASLWSTIWQLWPIVLILVGVEIILGMLRLPAVLNFLLALIIVAASVAGIVSFAFQSTQEVALEPGAAQHVEQPLQAATSASVRLGFGAGTLRLGAVGGGNIMEGDFQQAGSESPVRVSYSVSGGTGNLRVDIAESQVIPIFTAGRGNVWDVRLNNTIPLDVRIEAGAATNDLDLTDLRLRDLRVEAGLSTTTVHLPKSGIYSARFSGGLATTTVYIPEGVAARIRVEGGLSSVQVDESRFPKSGDYYMSPDYSTATNKVNLRLEGGLATINVR